MKVILSSHLPGVIDILIPIALPFRNVVELAGDLQTTMKSIEGEGLVSSRILS